MAVIDIGRRTVLFGSNHPFWPATDCLPGLDDLALDEPTTQAFLHDNAVTAFALRLSPLLMTCSIWWLDGYPAPTGQEEAR